MNWKVGPLPKRRNSIQFNLLTCKVTQSKYHFEVTRKKEWALTKSLKFQKITYSFFKKDKMSISFH